MKETIKQDDVWDQVKSTSNPNQIPTKCAKCGYQPYTNPCSNMVNGVTCCTWWCAKCGNSYLKSVQSCPNDQTPRVKSPRCP